MKSKLWEQKSSKEWFNPNRNEFIRLCEDGLFAALDAEGYPVRVQGDLVPGRASLEEAMADIENIRTATQRAYQVIDPDYPDELWFLDESAEVTIYSLMRRGQEEKALAFIRALEEQNTEEAAVAEVEALEAYELGKKTH